MNSNYHQCNFCVMDSTAPEIVFDETGRCNFCKHAEIEFKKLPYDGSYAEEILRMRRKGKGKKYDCLIGLSGGADSSTALHIAKCIGLRPLCFSVDNGYNSPQADENIMNLVEKLEVPFHRVVLDLSKFKHLQAAFIESGVKNLEIPTDHVLMAVSLELAAKHGIKYIISGGNVATESIMPPSWGYQARDLKHIKAIYRKFAKEELKGLPTCGIWKYNWYRWVKGIRTFYLLDHFRYVRNQSGVELNEKYGWKDVGQKHEESDFTKWFQNFYLYEKWGIDKRKAHYSSMIVSNQMTREEAMQRLEEDPQYPEFGLERRILRFPRHEHSEYPTDEKLWQFLSSIIKFLRHFGLCKS